MIISKTAVGKAATFAAQNGGPRVVLQTFKISSTFGYTPTLADEDIRGTVVYSGAITGYTVDPNGSGCEFSALLSKAVGNFDVGSVALYLDTGECYCIGVLQQGTMKKIALPNPDANAMRIRVPLQETDASAIFVLAQAPSGSVAFLPELANWSYLAPPAAMPAPVYVMLVGDEVGNRSTVTHTADNWSVNTHPNIRVSGQVSAASGNDLNSPALGSSIVGPQTAGRYLLRITSGAGIARIYPIASGTVNAVNILGSGGFPSGAVPQVGDTFDILESTTSMLSGTSSGKIVQHPVTSPRSLSVGDKDHWIGISTAGAVTALPVNTDLPDDYRVGIMNVSAGVVTITGANFVFRNQPLTTITLQQGESVELLPSFNTGQYLTLFHPV